MQGSSQVRGRWFEDCWRRAARPLKLAVAAVALIYVLGNIAGSTQSFWNGGRLAATFAIASGQPPFHRLDQGPILSTMYGPVTYLYYLPCALFYKQASLAVMAGSLLSFAAFAVPVFIILRGQRRLLGGVQAVWLAALCVLQIMAYQSLSYSAFKIHADAPAMLFASLCVLLLAEGRGQPASWRAIFLSAVCGTLAAWTKQTLVPILVLPLALALARKDSWRLRLGLFGWVAMLNLLLLAGFAAWWGGEALLDNAWRIPAACPIANANFLGIQPTQAAGLPAKLKSAVVEMHVITGKYLAPYLLCLFACLLLSSLAGKARGLLLKPAGLPALLFSAALLCLPGAAAGVLKAGGWINSESPFAWFLILGFLSLLAGLGPPETAETPGRPWNLACVVQPVFVGVALLGLVGNLRRLPLEVHQIFNPFDNDQETALRIDRQSPGTCYFPWHPLVGLIVEGRLYHFEDGLISRTVAGKDPSTEHVYAFIPPKAAVLGWPKDTLMSTNYFLNLRPTSGPSDPQSDRFDWYAFDRRP